MDVDEQQEVVQVSKPMNLDTHNTLEMQNMKDKCKEYEEQLRHRFYKFNSSLKNSVELVESEDEEPFRPMRYQRIAQLMNCYDDEEFTTLFTRYQDQFKCWQNMDRTTSQLIKKEKQLQLKNVLHSKVKRAKKASVHDMSQDEALHEPKNIAVKLLSYKEIKDELQNSLMEHYMATKKIYPTFSVLNPMLLNQIRVSKRKKYI